MPEPIVTLNEESIRSDLRELVGKTVGGTLSGLFEAKALAVAEEPERMRLGEAARVVREGLAMWLGPCFAQLADHPLFDLAVEEKR